MITAAWSLSFGLIAGTVVHRWLRRATYRYHDERHLEPVALGWVGVSVMALSMFVAVGQASRGLAFAVLATGFVPVFAALAAIDLDTRRLPDILTLPGAVAALAGVTIVSVVEADGAILIRSVLAAFALSGFYLVSSLVGDMGLGDAKFALQLGLLLGAASWAHVIAATIVAFLTAGVQALYLLLVARAGRKSHLAFGPHMALGAVITLGAPAVIAMAGQWG